MNIFEYAKMKKMLGGGGAEPIPLNVSQNGIYTAPQGQAYSPVNVAVKDIELIEGDYFEEGIAKFVIWLPEGRTTVGIRFRQPSWSLATVDWGDGATNTQEYNGNGQNIRHTYESGGYHIVKLIPAQSNDSIQLGRSAGYEPMFYRVAGNYNPHSVVVKAYIGGSNFRMGHSSFYMQRFMQTFVGVDNMYFTGEYAFSGCCSLRTVTIPNGTTMISGYQFRECDSLSKIVFPPSVISIRTEAFAGCPSILTYDFSQHESVPTLEKSNAFSDLSSSGGKILVPSALYDEWIAATNWSALASNIVAV